MEKMFSLNSVSLLELKKKINCYVTMSTNSFQIKQIYMTKQF